MFFPDLIFLVNWGYHRASSFGGQFCKADLGAKETLPHSPSLAQACRTSILVEPLSSPAILCAPPLPCTQGFPAIIPSVDQLLVGVEIQVYFFAPVEILHLIPMLAGVKECELKEQDQKVNEILGKIIEEWGMCLFGFCTTKTFIKSKMQK
ncbi:hypothetical protein ACS0TY_034513 [Phlomoides rotata]